MNLDTVAPLLSVRDLRLDLPTAGGMAPVLRGIDFEMQRGATLGLIGESGCGKSLTALAIMGLLPARSQLQGSMRLNGVELTQLKEADRCGLRGTRMAMIFQEPMTALNPLQPIWRQISELLYRRQGVALGLAKARALELLERVQLHQARARLDAYPHQLSGGQRQRVMIAMALAGRPDLLIADEPTTALDMTVQKEVLALIQKLVQEDGMGLLLISHDLSLMRDQVERVLVMYGGLVVENASTGSLFAQRAQHAHPYTQGLLAARPNPEAKRGSRLSAIAGQVPELFDWPLGCAFSDRCPHVVAGCRSSVPALERLPAEVTAATRSGHEHWVRCAQWRALVRSQ